MDEMTDDLDEFAKKYLICTKILLAWKNKEIIPEPNGHVINLLRVDWFSLARLDMNLLEKLLEAINSEVPLVEYVGGLEAQYSGGCATCGRVIELETNGTTIRAKHSCRYPDGIPLAFELNIPSGVMIVANDLRPVFDFEGDYDINNTYGCVQTSQAMAKIGCAHAYVGNSDPGVYKTSEKTFIIARSGYDRETDEKIKPEGEKVARITTSLWWYSIVDSDEFAKRGCEGKYHVDRVTVIPGVYRFTHYGYLHHDRDDTKPFTYTLVEWVRDPDSIKDYLADWKARNFTAGQIIANSIRNYPNLYSGPDAVQDVADHIFCTIGGGGDWHPNGFVQYDPDMSPDDPEIEIPVFDKRYRWYPMCEFSALLCAAGMGDESINLNPSFQALAYNVLDCIVKYGSEPLNPNHSDNSQELARRCLEALEKRYPRS